MVEKETDCTYTKAEDYNHVLGIDIALDVMWHYTIAAFTPAAWVVAMEG